MLRNKYRAQIIMSSKLAQVITNITNRTNVTNKIQPIYEIKFVPFALSETFVLKRKSQNVLHDPDQHIGITVCPFFKVYPT
jgi:hypothetical protein